MSVFKSTVFECFICEKQLNLPRDFPCQHTFCESCIRSLIEKTDHAEYLKLECPVCFEGFSLSTANLSLQELVDLFPKNQLIEDLNCAANSKEARKSCNPCRMVNEEKNAQYHCKECRQSLCEVCYTYMHRRIPGQESHRVTPLKIYLESEPFDVPEFCQAHPKILVEIYCHDHDILCCTSCMDSDHKFCLYVETLDQAFGAKEKCRDPLVLKKLIGNIREKVDEALETLEKQEKTDAFRNIDEEVSNFVSKFVDRLATIGRNFDLYLKNIYEGNAREGLLPLCKIQDMQVEGFLQLLTEAQQIIQGVKQAGSKRQNLLTQLQLKQQLGLALHTLQKCFERRTDRELIINPMISEKFENIDSLAEIQEKVLDSLLTTGIQEQLHLLKLYLTFDLECVTTRYSDIVPQKQTGFTQKENSRKVHFIDGVLLSSGKIFLIDSNERELVSLDQDGKFTMLYEFSYYDSPTAICADDTEETVAVSTERELLLFRLFPAFELVKTIEVQYSYQYVQFFNENFVCVRENEIVLVNKEGDILRTYYRPKVTPTSIAASSDGKKLYIPVYNDYDTPMIMCLGLNGQVVFRRKIPLEFEDRRVSVHGMDLDRYGNLYFCEAGGDVLQLSSDGSKIRTLFKLEPVEVRKKEIETTNSDDSDSDSDPEYDELKHQKSISFDKSGTKFLLFNQTNTVKLYDIS